MPRHPTMKPSQMRTCEESVETRIRLGAIQKSGRVLWAFSEFYLPFYGLGVEDLFRRWGLLAGIAALVYDVDEAAEVDLATRTRPDLLVLRRFLARHITVDSRIAKLLDDARRYYDAERAMMQPDASYSFDNVIEATNLRSFDFRLMHRALVQLENEGYDEALFMWFEGFEALMEIEDDLQTVETDAQRGTFNAPNLARRVEMDATSMLELWRTEKERELCACTNGLSSSRRGITESVMRRYRQLVPRLPVGK